VHALRCRPDLSIGEACSDNLLLRGDNLLALNALLPEYAARVKCAYIDPPYNTGNETWVYNDNVTSPEIEQWLGRVVGSEVGSLSRHDKWLCMIYPRLVLLRELLSEAGSLWMSIDDHEIHRARMMLDEVFGEDQFVAVITWQKKYSAANDSAGIPAMHDYLTPKPTRLIRRILHIANQPGDLVLDAFAGSGTTGHALLQLNRENGGQRRLILVEMEPTIAREIMALRLQRVIEGYQWTDQRGNAHREEGLGGRFCFFELELRS
jgi:adenine specific DNA methylase Mod